MQRIIDNTQVNIPLEMLFESYLDMFLKHGLNPEIGLDSKALERFSLSDYETIAARLHERGLTITLHAPFLDLSPGSPDPGVRNITRRRFDQVLRLVPVFRPRSVVCHAAYDWKRYAFLKAQWVENSIETWSWLGQRIRDEGSLLMLENVYERDPDEIRILFERLRDHRVGFCLDTGHQSVFSNRSLKTWIDSLGPFLGQVHLHDNRGKEDNHMAMGHGRIDFLFLFTQLKAIKDSPPIITLEPHREGDYWPSIEYLEKIWPW